MAEVNDIQALVRDLIQKEKDECKQACRGAWSPEERQEYRCEENGYVRACQDVLRLLKTTQPEVVERSAREILEDPDV